MDTAATTTTGTVKQVPLEDFVLVLGYAADQVDGLMEEGIKVNDVTVTDKKFMVKVGDMVTIGSDSPEEVYESDFNDDDDEDEEEEDTEEDEEDWDDEEDFDSDEF